MKYPPVVCVVLLALFLISCVGNDDSSVAESVSRVPDFTLLGEDTSNIYQYRFEASTGNKTMINLTDELRVPRQFITLRQVDNLITFYSFSDDNFSAVQTNVTTGESQALDNFYTNSPERSVIWGANSENKLFLAYYSPIGSSDLGVRFIETGTGTARDVSLEVTTRNVFEPFYRKGKLFVPYENVSSGYMVAVLDTESETLLETMDFGNNIPSILSIDDGNIAIFLRSSGNAYEYRVYDIDTLVLLSTTDFNLSRFFLPGPVEADIIGDILYYLNFYAQPFPIPFGPALYDFSTGQNRILDMVSIVQEVESELNATLILTAFGYKPEGRSFLIGFTTEGSPLFQGGLLVVSDEGVLLDRLTLPFVPIYILR